MVIEILNSGEILFNCKFKLNRNLNLNLYLKIPRNSNLIKISIRLCTVRYREISSILTIWLKSLHHSGFWLTFNSAFRVSSSTERAVRPVRHWNIPREFLTYFEYWYHGSPYDPLSDIFLFGHLLRDLSENSGVFKVVSAQLWRRQNFRAFYVRK